jgi:hypothetical protein
MGRANEAVAACRRSLSVNAERRGVHRKMIRIFEMTHPTRAGFVSNQPGSPSYFLYHFGCLIDYISSKIMIYNRFREVPAYMDQERTPRPKSSEI